MYSVVDRTRFLQLIIVKKDKLKILFPNKQQLCVYAVCKHRFDPVAYHAHSVPQTAKYSRSQIFTVLAEYGIVARQLYKNV